MHLWLSPGLDATHKLPLRPRTAKPQRDPEPRKERTRRKDDELHAKVV